MNLWLERDRFLAYIHRLSGGSNSSSDVFQEACFRFLRAKTELKTMQHARSYFYRIIRNLVIDERRRGIRWRFDPVESVPPHLGTDPNQNLLGEEISDLIERYLPLRDQRFLALYLDPSLPRIKDKCQALNLSYGTVRYHWNRILKNLNKLAVGQPTSGN